MTPDEIARLLVSTHTGISFALDKDRERLVERIAAAIAAERERAEKAETDLNKVYMDERGVTWCRPTAWAYAQVCMVRDNQIAAERAAREKAEADKAGALLIAQEHAQQVVSATARAEKAEAERDDAREAYQKRRLAHLAAREAALREAAAELEREDRPRAAAIVLALIDKQPQEGE